MQPGQVGQPSPEPVSRTAPPVITMRTLATIDAYASRRNTWGVASRSSTRFSVDTWVHSPASRAITAATTDPIPAHAPFSIVVNRLHRLPAAHEPTNRMRVHARRRRPRPTA